MKLKLFFDRGLSIIMMLILMAVSSIFSLVMFFVSSKITGQNFYFPWMLFGDLMIPLLFFIPAIIFRNRYCALAGVISVFINIFVRISTIIIFHQTFMPLDYNSLRLLLEHADLEALKATAGENFYYWAIPLALFALAAMIYCCVLTWKTFNKTPRRISRQSLRLFTVLLTLSLLSNIAFQIIRFCTSMDNYLAVRPLPLIIVNITQNTISELQNKNLYISVPLPESSREILVDLKLIDPPEQEILPGEAAFDKIIIIAVESLDYAFIRRTNPDMPDGITPNLDHFSEAYPSMTNYYAANHPTSWGLTALLLSRFDYNRDRHILPESLFSIARTRDYHTVYYAAASGHFGDNRRVYQMMFRPDQMMFREELSRKYEIRHASSWGVSDNDLFRCVLQELETGKHEKFIAVISTIDTHPPYYSHPDMPESEKERFPSMFLQALHNTDRELGKFLRAVMNDPELYNERTLIIVTADHSATFGENYLQRTDLSPDRIPLIFITERRDIFADLDLDKFASSIDLPPTLLRLIGAPVPETFIGRDLFSDKNFAITRLFNDTLLFYSPQGDWGVSTTDPNADLPPQEKAVRDLFYFHYGLPR